MDYSLVGMSVVQDPFKDVSTNVKKKTKKTRTICLVLLIMSLT